MNKKNKTKIKSTTSIARKINAMGVRDLFFKYLLIDIILIFIVIIFWGLNLEKNYFGEIFQTAKRSFDIYDGNQINYIVTSPNGQKMVANLSGFLFSIRYGIFIVLGIELLELIEKMIFGTRKIRKLLKPVDELTEMANKLSEMTIDEEKFQAFEDAISNISPTSSSARINIGDSDLKGLEDAINGLLDKMREAYKQQARFVSDASHELRTPISVIQGYANMLDRWGKKDEAVLEESINAIKLESESMKKLVEQLLFLARGINGKHNLTIEQFSLSKMIEDVLEEYKMIEDKHTFKFECKEEISVVGDISLLKQTARILVDNAIRYTEEDGEIILKVGEDTDDIVYFAVQDDGIGINEEDVKHIFERFYRADVARVRKEGGTGLGLSIAKWIVDNHRGYFSVLSRKGIGTRITVFIPIIDKA